MKEAPTAKPVRPPPLLPPKEEAAAASSEVAWNPTQGKSWNELNRAVHGAAESMGADHDTLHRAVVEAGKKNAGKGGRPINSVADLTTSELKDLYKAITGEEWIENKKPSTSRPRPSPKNKLEPPRLQ